jgi:hypothetical protein
MALSRLLLGWLLVTAWLLAWELVAGRGAPGLRATAALVSGEGVLLTLVAGLWFGSLGAGAWWLLFGLLGALREWPAPAASGVRARSRQGWPAALPARALRVLRILAAGGILAWSLGPA